MESLPVVKLEFCMTCGNSNPPDNPICKCGSRSFVFGYNFTFEDKEMVCGCGCKGFILSFRVNTNPIYTKNYKCINCSNTIGMQTYYQSPYSH